MFPPVREVHNDIVVTWGNKFVVEVGHMRVVVNDLHRVDFTAQRLFHSVLNEQGLAHDLYRVHLMRAQVLAPVDGAERPMAKPVTDFVLPVAQNLPSRHSIALSTQERLP